MGRRGRIRMISYTAAALAALGLYSALSHSRLEDYRRLAAYSSQAGFQLAVGAVDAMGTALQKSLYATDPALGQQLQAQAYAGALAGETALSALPFATQELEQLSAFLNQTGDYMLSLSPGEGWRGYEGEELEQVQALALQAEDFAATLRQLQSGLDNGLLIMDSREERLRNIGLDQGQRLSQALLEYEGLFDAGTIDYDGRYALKEAEQEGELDEEQILALAAKVAGVEPMELKEEYRYSGTELRRCYSAGGLSLCLSSRGLESLGQSRLVGTGRLNTERARQQAEAFLELLELEPMALVSYSDTGTLASFDYAPLSGQALRIDRGVRVTIALDDGSVYAYNAQDYAPAQGELSWAVDRDQAGAALPEGLEEQSARQVTILTDGGREIPCYHFSCIDRDGRSVQVYVDGQTGRQCRIDI